MYDNGSHLTTCALDTTSFFAVGVSGEQPDCYKHPPSVNSDPQNDTILLRSAHNKSLSSLNLDITHISNQSDLI